MSTTIPFSIRQASATPVSVRDYAIVLAMLVVSGNPIIMSFGPEVIYIPFFGLMLLRSIVRRTTFAYRDLMFLMTFVAISLVHVVTFGTGVIPASAGFLVKLAIALMVVRMTSDFCFTYVKVMSALALVSLVIFLPYKVGFDLPEALSALNLGDSAEGVNIGVHNFHWEPNRVRNSGMFWEPGAFAGYLLLAALFIVISTKKVQWGHLVLLLTAILTTESTMGYIALVLVALLLVYKLRLRFDRYLRVVVYPLLMVALFATTVVAYNELPFLREKIEHQLLQAEIERGRFEVNRFGNLLYDLRFIAGRPLFGWSPWHVARGEEASQLATSQGNGISGFAVRYGVIGVVALFAAMFAGFHSVSRSLLLATAACGVVSLILLGEQFLNFPVFLTLSFLKSRHQ